MWWHLAQDKFLVYQTSDEVLFSLFSCPYPARQHTTCPTPLRLFKCCFVGVSLCWGLIATHEETKHEAAHFTFIQQTRLTWMNESLMCVRISGVTKSTVRTSHCSIQTSSWENENERVTAICNDKCQIKYLAAWFFLKEYPCYI